MILHLVTILFNKLGSIIILAVILSKINIFKRALTKKRGLRENVILILIFGTIGIFGTYFGVKVEGAIANSRVIGAITGGLIGGPIVGIGAGLIAGIHRWAIDIGGFTSLACAISTIVAGIIGGLSYKYIKDKKNKWFYAFVIGVISELLQMVIILLVAKPFSDALNLVEIIMIPMVVVNSLGILLFIAVVENIFIEESRIKAAQAQVVLSIADKTVPYLRKGLKSPSIDKVAKIIYDMNELNLSAVAITDKENILVHIGSGEDHHFKGHPIQTDSTREVVESGCFKVIQKQKDIGCNDKRCNLSSAVLVPLKEKEKTIGVLKLYKDTENSITSVEVELALGMAKLFSTQLELSKLERQEKLLQDAELKVLQAQINPHFLFNALNTIMSYCRIDPEKARVLIGNLGAYYRSNLQGSDFSSLAQEINHIKAYLSIEEARFEDRMKVIFDIEPRILNVQVPSLILQPIVENSVKHGLLPKDDSSGFIKIKGELFSEEIRIIIKDNGLGFKMSRLKQIFADTSGRKSIGLKNVNNRLINIYGSKYRLKIISAPGKGTEVTVTIPLKGEEDGFNSYNH